MATEIEKARARAELKVKAASLRNIIYNPRSSPEAVELAKLELLELERETEPAEAEPTLAQAEANEARSAAWREADAKFWAKKRELEGQLARADPTLAAGRREALEKELQQHIKAGPPAPEPPAAA